MKIQFKISNLFLVAAMGAVCICPSAWADKGRTNPFELPSGVTYKGRQLPSVSDLDLQAVVEGKTRRVATINNRNYLVGDMVKAGNYPDCPQSRGPGRGL